MSVKRVILTTMTLLFMLSMTACQRINSPLGNPSGQIPDNTDWKWKSLGFENKNVDEIQITGNDKLFVLSDGKLYSLKENKWRFIGPDADISNFCVTEEQGSVVILAGGTDGKLYINRAGDDRWNEAPVRTLSGPVNIMTVSPSTGDIYMGQSSKHGGGLYKSDDGGRSWEKLTDITVRGIAVHPENPDIIYIVDKLTYLTTDGGQSWTKVETGANYGVLIHPMYPEIAYLAYAQGVVSVNHVGEVLSQQQFYLSGAMTRLEFNPCSLNEWALGMWDYPSGVGGLYYTFNGGGHWISLEEEMGAKRILDIRYSKDGKRLYVGTAGGGLWMLNIEKLK